MIRYMFLNTANLLTLFRIFLIPVLVVAFFVNTTTWRFIAASVFIFGCLTDYLDGYIARAYDQVSKFGQFLDPVADKLLVTSTLLLLAGFDRISHISLIPATIILAREILISGLREHLVTAKISVRVTRLAKWKTAIQMSSICLLLVGETSKDFKTLSALGEITLWVSALLAVVTAYQYIRSTYKHFQSDIDEN